MPRFDPPPSFGRPDPQPQQTEDTPDDSIGKLRVALHPVLDPEAAARVEQQIRLMVAQAVRDGFLQALAEMTSEQAEQTPAPAGDQLRYIYQ